MEEEVGRYTLTRVIGKGAFSTVRLGINKDTGQRVAVKIIDKKILMKKKLQSQLTREIKVMLSLDHPNLVKLYEVMKSKKYFYLVLELVEGGELFKYLNENGPMEEDVARSFFHQLVDAIGYMHDCHTTHRDLKPENILLTEDGRIKIADFGLSILTTDHREVLTTRCGTPFYVAPEVFREYGYLGPPVDVWSAGIILYVMLAGRLPFESPSIDILVWKIISGQVVFPKNISIEARDLLRHMMEVNPKKRYTIDEIRNHQWFIQNYTKINGNLVRKSNFHVINLETNQNQLDSSSSSDTPPSPAKNKKKNHIKEVTDDEKNNTLDAFELMSLVFNVDLNPIICNKKKDIKNFYPIAKTKDEIFAMITHAMSNLNGNLIPMTKPNTYKLVFPSNTGKITIKASISNIYENLNRISFTKIKGEDKGYNRIARYLVRRFEC